MYGKIYWVKCLWIWTTNRLSYECPKEGGGGGGGGLTMYGTEEGEWGYFQFPPFERGWSFLEQPKVNFLILF